MMVNENFVSTGKFKGYQRLLELRCDELALKVLRSWAGKALVESLKERR